MFWLHSVDAPDLRHAVVDGDKPPEVQSLPPASTLSLQPISGLDIEEATNYLSAATGRPKHARDRPGDKFDIRGFHDVLLKHRQIPLSVMEHVVDDWIESELNE